MTTHTIVLTVIAGAVIAGAYGLLVYARRRRQGEAFNPYALAATIIVGAVWGGVNAASGRSFGQGDVEAALVSYVGLVTLTEAGVKWLVEEYRHFRG